LIFPACANTMVIVATACPMVPTKRRGYE
jgi:hypothetical protein